MSTKTTSFYITTAIDYVNGRPHIGHALEKIQADVIARFHRLKGDDVWFLTGTDENSLKNVLAAEEAGANTKDFVDKTANIFRALKEELDLSWDDFIRTTEKRHIEGVRKFWQACRPEDIYQKDYTGLYCIGCEEFKTTKELENGSCPEHPGKKLQEVKEKNYFFRLSSYQEKLEKLIESGTLMIVPETRKNEILSFIHQGLEDFSISRSQERARGWGIPVPEDESQVIYVWFDALLNYITAIGYADDQKAFEERWGKGETLHIIGKGINRFHTVYWPAMLLSAGLPLPKKVFVHGYITVDGKKMSKSVSSVIDPAELVKKYGTDPVRYYLLREIPTSEDGDFSYAKFEERYNGDLANGIGNLVSRLSTLGERVGTFAFDLKNDVSPITASTCNEVFANYERHMEAFRLNEALGDIWQLIGHADRFINEKKPWAEKDPALFASTIKEAAWIVSTIANLLSPFLPGTAEKIGESIVFEGSVLKIKKSAPLFPRLS